MDFRSRKTEYACYDAALQFQDSCLAIYSPEVWQKLAVSDSSMTVFDTDSADQKPIIQLAIAGHGEDVIEWRDWSVDVVKGQEEPNVQGWLPTARHNELRPVPTAIYRRVNAGDAMIAYLIAPLRQGESMPSVEALETTGDVNGIAFRVTFSDELTYAVSWNSTTGRSAVFSKRGELLEEVPE